jgi:hypothetical protein
MMPHEGGIASDIDGAYRGQRLITFAGPCSLGIGADHAGDKLPDCDRLSVRARDNTDPLVRRNPQNRAGQIDHAF